MNLFKKIFIFIFIFILMIIFCGIFLDSSDTIIYKQNNAGKTGFFSEKKNETKKNVFSRYSENVEPIVNRSKSDLDKSYNEANEVDLKLSLTENRIKKYLKEKIKKNEDNAIKYLEECFTTTERRIEEILKKKIGEIDQKISLLIVKKNKYHLVDNQIKDEVDKQLAGLKARRLDTFYAKIKNEERRKKLLKEMLKGDLGV